MQATLPPPPQAFGNTGTKGRQFIQCVCGLVWLAAAESCTTAQEIHEIIPRFHGFFSSENHGVEEILKSVLSPIFFTPSDIDELKIRFLDS